ncbi:MAG TPA: hypothetical protein VFH54_17435 [Mycobacteriales bacterium]|nr:hypothetical protein [Mycobacteriales bacterium]
MSVLADLLASRDAAQKAYDEFVNPLIEAGADLTDEQQEKRTELRSAVEGYDARIDEVDAEQKRSAKLAEIRKGIGATPAATVAEVNEPTTYGKGSEHSYFLDLAHVALGPTDPGYEESRARILRASHEVAVEMLTNKDSEKRSRIRDLIKEEKRSAGKDVVRDAVKRYEALGQTGRSEMRALDTTASSGGSFVTPIYQVGEYAPFREAGRAFADQCNKQELPAYGMTVYIPHVTSAAAVAATSQNTAITEVDPTAAYLSGNLAIMAGEVTVSQALLDRAGPGFQYDAMVFDQLNRDYAPKLDANVLTAALAGAGTVAYTDSTGFHLNIANGTGGFYSKVSGAKSAIRKGAGTFLSPTHLFLDPARWEFISGWGDGNARPVVVPGYAGPWNAVAGGNADGDLSVDGPTGYRLNGLPVFTDANIPVPTVGADQAIVGDLREVYVFEGTPVTRAVPQTLANQLSILLQLYSYTTTIVRYPLGVQSVVGTGMSAISF